mmetsp:Transcript_39853/g.35205  ORF Transcript_39853/g.35205 Transcript_39853/m.35205 type:complete len:182 (+) Transcript_39853:1-546(+)
MYQHQDLLQNQKISHKKPITTMPSQIGNRVHLNSRKRKRDEYESESTSSDDSYSSSSTSQFEPPTKKRKLTKRQQRISHEKILRPMLKRFGESVMLQHPKRKKFIELAIPSCFKGSAYTTIKGDFDTDGIRNTRNFRSKDKAFKAALQLLANKMCNGFSIVESDEDEEYDGDGEEYDEDDG